MMPIFRRISVIVLLTTIIAVSGFVIHPERARSKITTTTNTKLQLKKTGGRKGGENHRHLEEMERARRSFEKLIGPLLYTTGPPEASVSASKVVDQTKADPSSSSSSLITSQQPLLTNGSRKRREIEIQLLLSLQDSDDGIDELMNLWLDDECPNEIVSKDALHFMEDDCSTGNEEIALKNIILKCPYWAEPSCRLALLLFIQQRYDECQIYINNVLILKPWHFEAIQIQLLLCLVQGNYKSAVYWARKGLPPLSQYKKRIQWVNNSVQQAKHLLSQLEQHTLETIHTSPKVSNNSNNNNNNNNIYDINNDIYTPSATTWQ